MSNFTTDDLMLYDVHRFSIPGMTDLDTVKHDMGPELDLIDHLHAYRHNFVISGGFVAGQLDSRLFSMNGVSDIDLFVYGTTSKKRKEVGMGIIAVLKNYGGDQMKKTITVRGSVVTFYFHTKNMFPIQVILSDFETKYQILNSFDLSICQVLIDPSDTDNIRVLGTKEYLHTMNYRSITVLNGSNSNWIVRLAKYLLRHTDNNESTFFYSYHNIPDYAWEEAKQQRLNDYQPNHHVSYEKAKYELLLHHPEMNFNDKAFFFTDKNLNQDILDQIVFDGDFSRYYFARHYYNTSVPDFPRTPPPAPKISPRQPPNAPKKPVHIIYSDSESDTDTDYFGRPPTPVPFPSVDLSIPLLSIDSPLPPTPPTVHLPPLPPLPPLPDTPLLDSLPSTRPATPELYYSETNSNAEWSESESVVSGGSAATWHSEDSWETVNY